MAIPAPLLPPPSLLLFLIISSATAAAPPAPAGPNDLIHVQCQETQYYDLCLSSLLSRPGSSNATLDDMGKLAFGPVFDSAKDTRKLLSKLMRDRLDSASKRALRACGKQYDLAIKSLVLADKYMKSDGFKYHYEPVKGWVDDAEQCFTRCGEILKSQRELVESFMQKNEIVRRLADNADVILYYLVV